MLADGSSRAVIPQKEAHLSLAQFILWDPRLRSRAGMTKGTERAAVVEPLSPARWVRPKGAGL